MPNFHCFLSYNSADKSAVQRLKQALEAKGLRCWYDADELIPGRTCQPLMEQGIRGAASIAVCVCVGGDGLGPWQSEEMQAALQLAVRENRPIIPVLLPDAPLRPELPMFLTNRTWVDLRDGIDGAGLDQLIWGITGERPDGFIERDNSTETPAGHRRILAAGGMIAMVLVLLLWWAWPLLSVDSSRIAGRILDEDGAPLAGIEVAIPDQGRSTHTNSFGHFELGLDSSDGTRIELLARGDGYRIYRDTVTAGNTGIGFKLHRSP